VGDFSIPRYSEEPTRQSAIIYISAEVPIDPIQTGLGHADVGCCDTDLDGRHVRSI